MKGLFHPSAHATRSHDLQVETQLTKNKYIFSLHVWWWWAFQPESQAATRPDLTMTILHLTLACGLSLSKRLHKKLVTNFLWEREQRGWGSEFRMCWPLIVYAFAPSRCYSLCKWYPNQNRTIHPESCTLPPVAGDSTRRHKFTFVDASPLLVRTIGHSLCCCRAKAAVWHREAHRAEVLA